MINKAENGLDKRLVNEIKSLRRDLIEYKTTAQPIGSSGISVKPYPDYPAINKWGPITIPANDISGLGFAFSVSAYDQQYRGVSARDTIWTFRSTIYVDGTGSDDAYPAGNNIYASNKRKCIFSVWQDYADATDDSIQVWVRIHNFDTVSHQYYIQLQAQFPTIQGVS